MDITNTIKAIIILGVDGKRTLAKYYDGKINQKTFEKNIFSKTHRTKDEVLVVDGCTIVHKTVNDMLIYVVGSSNENPLLLSSVLTCLHEVVSSLLQKNVERQSLMDHLDEIILALDEICDGGVVIETDSSLVMQRIFLKDDPATISNFMLSARDIGFSFGFRT